MASAFCPGFTAAGVSAGLKREEKKDLGLIYSDSPATAAGVFTRNRVQAAPVRVCRERLRSGTCRAVIVNSKNANCCTGVQGLRDAESMTRVASDLLGIPEAEVLVASTGVIGEPLPIDRIVCAAPDLVGALSPEGFDDFSRAIMTTDTVPKLISRTEGIDGKSFTVTGVAKGSGMIRPDMATMLCFVCSDVAATPARLGSSLADAVEGSFNRISIDGDTSTNDTALLFANGVSGVDLASPKAAGAFQEVLEDVLGRLARMLVKDGEGVTKLVEIVVRGADTGRHARQVADTVAHSPLVKTAFFGEDANWGRILGAVGRSGVDIDPDRIDLYFDDVRMVRDGRGCGKEAESAATAVLKRPEFRVTVDLKRGAAASLVLTCDFSVDYVRINADYRS